MDKYDDREALIKVPLEYVDNLREENKELRMLLSKAMEIIMNEQIINAQSITKIQGGKDETNDW